MQITAVTALFADLPEAELIAWVERGWVRPEPAGASWTFREIDVARVRLILDLRRTMDVQEETVPVVLSLLDQVYALRGQLRAVLHAVESQPEPMRAAILSTLVRS
jgi:chaperone modulatory protein CbpM